MRPTHFALLALPLIAGNSHRSSGPAHQPPATQLVLLGTGTPNDDPDRSGPALAIIVGNNVYLVDAGPGIVRRAALARRRDSITALAPPNLRRVFITHLHSDHTVGLPDLIFSPWVLERRAALEIYGPRGTRRMANLLESAYSEDIAIRLRGGEPSNKTGYAVSAHDVSPGVVYRDSNVTVTAFEVAHGKWAHALGYRFQTRDRSIVVSGDTGPTDAVVRACDGCDILVHEVYSASRLKTRTPDWQRYHRAYHTSGEELGSIAQRARPKLLVLYHQLYWGDTDEGILGEVRTHFTGRVVSGQDLDRF
jgi:ribonuclease BN (tRNA processing enzyme)